MEAETQEANPPIREGNEQKYYGDRSNFIPYNGLVILLAAQRAAGRGGDRDSDAEEYGDREGLPSCAWYKGESPRQWQTFEECAGCPGCRRDQAESEAGGDPDGRREAPRHWRLPAIWWTVIGHWCSQSETTADLRSNASV